MRAWSLTRGNADLTRFLSSSRADSWRFPRPPAATSSNMNCCAVCNSSTSGAHLCPGCHRPVHPFCGKPYELDDEGHGQRIWCSKSGACTLSVKPALSQFSSDSYSCSHGEISSSSEEEEQSECGNVVTACPGTDIPGSRSKLSKEQRSQIWQRHLLFPKLSQKALADWAKDEFKLEQLTQATISKVLSGFRSTTAIGGNLTNAQVQLIIQQSKIKRMTQEKLRDWSKKEFNLKKRPSQSTISRILNNKRGVPEVLDDRNRGLKRKRTVKSAELDKILVEWILQRQANRVCLTWTLIQAKAKNFADQLALSDSQRPSFSDGWLEKFLQRHGLKTVVMSGESGSADVAAINDALPGLRATIRSYAPRDVFNMDETGLFYCLAPDRTIASRQMEGMKKDKTRVSVALCANSDGTEKEKLMIIGHSAKPRAFNKKTGQQLGFYYRFNQKAWMTALLFQEWLLNFDSRMRGQQRQVLLLLDNAPTHMIKNLTLSSVKVMFLPPNTTSRIQPMDAGIIAAFKKRYRSLHIAHAIDRDAGGEKSIYKVDILKAMRWMKAAWSAVSSETISNCFRHTGLLSDDDSTPPRFIVDDDFDTELSENLKKLSIGSVLSLEEMAKQESDIEIHHSFTDQELIELFSDVVQDDAVSSEDDMDNGPSLDEKIQALRITLSLLVDNPIENETAIRQIRHLLLQLSREKADNHTESLKQSDIRSFFKQ